MNEDNDDDLPGLKKLEKRLMTAACTGDVVGLRIVLKEGPVNVDCHRPWKRLEHLEQLVAFKTPEEIRKFILNWSTPLQLAAYRGHVECVETLLGAGALANKEHASAFQDTTTQTGLSTAPKTSCSYTAFETELCGNALHWACLGGSVKVVNVLLQSDTVDGECSDMFFRSAMHWAARGGNADVISQTAIGAGEFYDSNGWSPIHIAAQVGSVETLRALEEKKMDLFGSVSKSDSFDAQFYSVEFAVQGLHAKALDFLLQKWKECKTSDKVRNAASEGKMIDKALQKLLRRVDCSTGCSEKEDKKMAEVVDVLFMRLGPDKQNAWTTMAKRAIECDLEQTLHVIITSRFAFLDAQTAVEMLQPAIEYGAERCTIRLLEVGGVSLCEGKQRLREIDGLADFVFNVILPKNPFVFHPLLAVLREMNLHRVFLEVIQPANVTLWFLLHDYCDEVGKEQTRRTAQKTTKRAQKRQQA